MDYFRSWGKCIPLERIAISKIWTRPGLFQSDGQIGPNPKPTTIKETIRNTNKWPMEFSIVFLFHAYLLTPFNVTKLREKFHASPRHLFELFRMGHLLQLSDYGPIITVAFLMQEVENIDTRR